MANGHSSFHFFLFLFSLYQGSPPHRKSSVKALFTAAVEGYPQPFDEPEVIFFFPSFFATPLPSFLILILQKWTGLFADFVSMCLQLSPADRPGASELLKVLSLLVALLTHVQASLP